MKHLLFNPDNDTSQLKVAILIKDSYFSYSGLKEYYIDTLLKQGIKENEIIAFDLAYLTKSVSVTQAREYMLKLLPAITKLGINTLYVADAIYFKALTKITNTQNQYGYVVPCKLSGFEHINILLGVNYGQLMYNPNISTKLEITLTTLVNHLTQGINSLGQNVVHSIKHPETKEQIEDSLYFLSQQSILACDIETYGLKLHNNRVATIAFAYDEHNAISFKVDGNKPIKQLLKMFFEKYTGTLLFHNATFDVKQIIHDLFMTNPLDYQGMLHGLDVMTKSIHDTKIIAYLATNSTAGNELGLKELSYPYMGNYAEDVSDITLLDDSTLLTYNAKDVLATFWVFKKYMPLMIKDNQQKIYEEIMLPSLKVIIQMELCGMPMNMKQVHKAEHDLVTLQQEYLSKLSNNPYVLQAQRNIQKEELDKINAKLKTKQHGLEKVADITFNRNSNYHVKQLLYDVLGLPVLAYTDSGEPSTDGKTLKKLIHYVQSDETKELLNNLIGLGDVNKILTTFIPAFKQCYPKSKWHYLHGSFNLGGTLSGRLSSSKPNLQNLPSGSVYGELVKQCFSAPKGWIMVGADFFSLEDRINALLTKDENKLKVYTDGYDGHSLRAYYYFQDNMPDIDPNSVESINSIADKYKQYRQESKAPTFALTYNGTYHTLMTNCGFNETKAKNIEASYHEMYKQSDEWAKQKIELCSKQGYIDVAFGLRIRTPILAKTVLGTKKTPYMALAEARSVGNAISGQSYGLLTNRAINEFMERVWKSEYRYDVMPISLIHDAIYLMIKDDVRLVEWVNNNLIECMQWQELEEIKHDEVHLGAELDLYYPSWANTITLNNSMSITEIKELVKNSL